MSIARKVQSRTMDDELFAVLAGVRSSPHAYDGVAEMRLSGEPQGISEERRLASDALLTPERRFIDLSASPILFTREHVEIGADRLES